MSTLMQNRLEAYSDFAMLYDFLIPDPSAMNGFYSGLLKDDIPNGGKLLEVGCGTGRFTLRAAKAGYAIDALDASHGMLNVLKTKCEISDEEIRSRITMHHQSMLKFELEGVFDGAFITGGTLQHCISEDEYHQAFTNVLKPLRSGSVFAFDIECTEHIENGAYRIDFPRVDMTSFSSNWKEARSWNEVVIDKGVHEINCFFELWSTTQCESHYTLSYHNTYPSIQTLKSMLKLHPLEDITFYGDFNRKPYEVGDKHLVVVAKKS